MNEECAAPDGRKEITLLDAPANAPLRVLALLGGEASCRRLLSLGFHRGDVVRLDSRAPFRGPVLVRNMTTGCQVALGRGVARKVVVEEFHEVG